MNIHFGVLADPIRYQLKAQGLKANRSKIVLWQKIADAIMILSVHDYLGDRQRIALRMRLLKRMEREAKP